MSDHQLSNGADPQSPNEADPLSRQQKRNQKKYDKKKTKKKDIPSPPSVMNSCAIPGPREDDWTLEPLNPDTYHFGRSENMGWGVYASRNIPRGARIMADSPIVIDPDLSMDVSQDAVLQLYRDFGDDDPVAWAHLEMQPDITKRWNALAARWSAPGGRDLETYPAGTQRNMAKLLSGLAQKICIPSEEREIKALHMLVDNLVYVIVTFESNFVLLGRKSGKAVFGHASHLNHSCRPNAYQNWNKDTGKLTVHALRHIQENEQILIDYAPSQYAEWTSRRNVLLHSFFVDCKCPVCFGPTSARSRERRSRMVHLNRLVTDWCMQTDDSQPEYWAPLEVRRAINECLSLQIKEEMFDLEMAKLYDFKAMIAADRGSVLRTIDLKQKAYSVLAMCFGLDHPEILHRLTELNELWKRKDNIGEMLNTMWNYSLNAVPEHTKVAAAKDLAKQQAETYSPHMEPLDAFFDDCGPELLISKGRLQSYLIALGETYARITSHPLGVSAACVKRVIDKKAYYVASLEAKAKFKEYDLADPAMGKDDVTNPSRLFRILEKFKKFLENVRDGYPNEAEFARALQLAAEVVARGESE